MADFSDKLGEIKTLLSSNTKSNKPFAYSSLLVLQEQSTTEPSCIPILAESSAIILPSILGDISDDDGDEEIVALALKCLGFMIYHPDLVSSLPDEDVNLLSDSLAKLITTTKMKSVCNLGVWCISIQQFQPHIIGCNFQSFLKAVVHALDNPFGSLSTTFEATQAVMKLVTQMNEKMKHSSHLWAPPIYRRLLSIDKRERDISQRCLLKIRSTIFPPLPYLSKVIVLDMKQKLLEGMNELLQRGMKVQTMQAWGWFIRLIGSHAIKNKRLVNQLLKIPQQAFTDHDSQLQISTLVAWEGVIDAFIDPSSCDCERQACEEITNGISADGTKSVKLIMTPLIGIMSSKCDASVHSACLNTWCYLLHKLDTSVTDPLVIKAVLDPIFEAVFRIGPDDKSIWSWNICLDLLDAFISAKSRTVHHDLANQIKKHISGRTTIPGKCSWTQYPIKWLPWDLTQLEFHIKMINILISRGIATVSPEYRSFAFDAALSLFRSVLRGIQMELTNSHIDYDEARFCLNMVLQFIKKICEDVTSEGNASRGLHHTALRFVKAVTEELQLSILGSPLYKVALDLKYIENLQSVNNEIRHVKVLAIGSITYMDMVSPLVYLTILYFSVVMQWTLHAPKMEFILQELHNYLKCLLSSYFLLENLHAVVGLLFKHVEFSCLEIWITISKVLKDYINGVMDLSQLELEVGSTSLLFCHLLTYPLIVYSCPEKKLPQAKINAAPELSLVSSPRELELEHVIEVWKSLYCSIFCASKFDCATVHVHSENLCSMLNDCLDENTSMLEWNAELDSRDKDRDHVLVLSGNAVLCVWEHVLRVANVYKNDDGGDDKRSNSINTIFGLFARFMRLSWMKKKAAPADPPAAHPLISTVLSVLKSFVHNCHVKQDILSFIQILSAPLLEGLAFVEVHSTLQQLQLLWTEVLNSLQRSQPPIVFDSSFLKLQAPLLEKTLDHPNRFISKSTTSFWNSTYALQVKLEYPQCLLHVLDKLSRNGTINLSRRSPPFLEKCNSRLELSAALQRYRVSATHNISSKRVELLDNVVDDDFGHSNELSPSRKRKRLELTEHQKEVRRAQQGRGRDCSGHGPGIRTYTSVDFSQGNDESQDSEMSKFQNQFRNAEKS